MARLASKANVPLLLFATPGDEVPHNNPIRNIQVKKEKPK
jgi:hypothetical protein